MTEQAQIANGRGKPERFIARSRLRTAARSELRKYADDIFAPAVAEAIVVIVREAVRASEERFAAKLAALEDAMRSHR